MKTQESYSGNTGWIVLGVLFGLLAIIIGVVVDLSNDDSNGRTSATIKGTLIQFGIGFVAAACGIV